MNEIMRRWRLLIQSLFWGRMCRGPAELSIQSSLAGVRKGKKVARLLKINLPACPFTTVTSVKEDDFPFSYVVFYISALYVFVGASQELFGTAGAYLSISKTGSNHLPFLPLDPKLLCGGLNISYSVDRHILLHLPPILWWLFIWTA